MTTYPTITPPDSLEAALAPLTEVSDTEFDRLLNAVSSPRSFSISPKALKELRAQTPSIANNLPYLLGALSFLYSRIEALGDIEEPFETLISKLVGELAFPEEEGDLKAKLQARLLVLLRKNPSRIHFEKIQRLRDGFTPNATAFRTLLDLRPDFGDGEDVVYNGLLKVIQFRVTTDATDSSQKDLVFQMSEEMLDELRKTIDRAYRKLEALKNEEKLAAHFIEID